MSANLLYYGDNLDILRKKYVKEESVDLIYLDPPFNSKQSYNVLFKERDGSQAASQVRAFEDTWRWDQGAVRLFNEFVVMAPERVSRTMQAFKTMLGGNDMLAYLTMMAPRLVELRRVLKPTGSLYLHCDSTASHYLKLLLDAIFSPENFRNQIIWRRTNAHSDAKQGASHFGRVHDTLLFYARSPDAFFQALHLPYSEEYVESHYRFIEEGTGRRYRKGDLTANRGGGDTSYEWNGVRPYKGRYWAYSRSRMEVFERDGRLVYTKSGMPEYKRYLDEMPGQPVQDVWDDINPINSQAAERLGYPTQKPESLLERIIKASSKEGDTILDPFCGCGTAVSVAQRLNRKWVGIDITYLAIGIVRSRLRDAFGKGVEKSFAVIGEPASLPDAEALARQDRFEFQFWIVSKLCGYPVERKKGKDRGIDGRIYFHDGREQDETKQAVISVKSGKTGPNDVRDLRGVLDREKAAIGILVTLEDPTREMRVEAETAGSYASAWGRTYPRLQLLTVEEIMAGDEIEMPPRQQTNTTFKKAPKVKAGEKMRQEKFAD